MSGNCFWFKDKECWQLEIHHNINKDICTPCLLAHILDSIDGNFIFRVDKSD